MKKLHSYSTPDGRKVTRFRKGKKYLFVTSDNVVVLIKH